MKNNKTAQAIHTRFTIRMQLSKPSQCVLTNIKETTIITVLETYLGRVVKQRWTQEDGPVEPLLFALWKERMQ